jgi:hypothetical protein
MGANFQIGNFFRSPRFHFSWAHSSCSTCDPVESNYPASLELGGGFLVLRCGAQTL